MRRLDVGARSTHQSADHVEASEDPSDFCDFGYDNRQVWNTIVFRTELSDQEVSGFADAVQARWKAQGIPGGCRAWCQKNKRNGVLILLNPQASAVVAQIPEYRPILQSCAAPTDMSKFPSFKPMRIFV